MSPSSGGNSPATMLIIDVLPAPERPNKAVTPGAVELNATSTVKPPSFFFTLIAGTTQPFIFTAIRLARISDARRAIRATITEITHNLSAPASPPGTWVREYSARGRVLV
jgi:hypothetical protein